MLPLGIKPSRLHASSLADDYNGVCTVRFALLQFASFLLRVLQVDPSPALTRYLDHLL